MNGIRGTARITVALLAGALLAGVLAGCASGGDGAGGYGSDGNTSPAPTGDSAASDIQGEWLLTKASDADGEITITTTPATLIIAKDSVSGRAQCNTFTGGATIDGTNIAIGAIATTLMACADDATTNLETRFLAALEKVTTAELSDGTPATLTLSGPDETLNFTIVEKKAAN